MGRIADIQPTDRPRERLAADGVAVLADRELVALVLRTGFRGSNALALADEILARLGGVKGLSRGQLDEIAAIPGVGAAKAAGLVAAFELGRREGRTPLEGLSPLRGPGDLAAVILPRLAGLTRESVLAIILDQGHRIRRLVPVSSGAADRALLPVREVLHAVLRNDGAAFALAHNHPSGDVQPSVQDIEGTKELARAAEASHIRFVDHLIVADRDWLSLREAGYFD